MIEVRFFTLSGKFTVAKKEKFPSLTEATKAVAEYASAAGFTNVKLVDGEAEFDSVRWTARTPKGRGGRNVADCDCPYDSAHAFTPTPHFADVCEVCGEAASTHEQETVSP